MDYDDYRDNPKLIEEIENRVASKISRGGSFALHPIHIIEIPERGLLRKNMQERYGIATIDDYFVPVVVDTNTYRAIKGEEEPDILENLERYHKKMLCLEGHVKKVNSHFISYISANLPLDESIEHEGIHAYMLRNNPHYRRFAPTLGFTYAVPPSFDVMGWLEAVSWVATDDNIDMDSIERNYISAPDMPLSKRLMRAAKLIGAGAVIAFDTAYKKIKEENGKDTVYAVAGKGVGLLHMIIAAMNSREKVVKDWNESFQLAAELKKEIGVKEFLRLAGIMHRDELGDLL